MKLVSFVAIAFSLTSITPSLASYQFDSTHVASRDWADEPFNLDAREYRFYERDLDEWELDERDLDIETLEDLLEREDFDLWERSPNVEENFLYPRAPTEAYKKLIALNRNMKAGKSYAFEMTFPLTDKEKKTPDKETPQEKRLREMQISLGYSHKALLVGTVEPKQNFVGALYDLTIQSKFTLHTSSRKFEWKVQGKNPLVSRGEVKSGWTPEKILKAGNDLNHSQGRKGKYGFEQWHCGLFAEELYLALTRDPPK